jgi:hypothetical protein
MSKLTPKDADRIAAVFNKKAPNARCPLCGHDDFGVPVGIVPVPILDIYPDLFGIGRKSDNHYPCAPIICKTCGATFLINLRVLGDLDDLMDPGPEMW